jgi:hypothetical protein
MCIHYNQSQLPNQETSVLGQTTWPSKSTVQAQFGVALGAPIGVGTTTHPWGLKEKWSLEDLFIMVYTVLDDAYKKLFGSPAALRRSPNHDPVFTDVEVITLALVAELAGYESQRAWWNFVNKNYRYLFRHLCDRTRYGRRPAELAGAHGAIAATSALFTQCGLDPVARDR